MASRFVVESLGDSVVADETPRGGDFLSAHDIPGNLRLHEAAGGGVAAIHQQPVPEVDSGARLLLNGGGHHGRLPGGAMRCQELDHSAAEPELPVTLLFGGGVINPQYRRA